MSNNIDHQSKLPKGKIMAGVILLIVGGILLIQQFNFFFFPSWLFSWPMWLIVWGLYVGAKHNFRKPIWFILIILGVGFLLDREIPGFDISGIMWPILIIAFGLWIILRRNYGDKYLGDTDQAKPNATFAEVDYTVKPNDDVPPINPNPGVPPYSPDDHLDATAIFGGVNKSIFSKNFRGGDITNIFGGTELDFTQADINGRVVIDITQVFGGTKIIVPANWHVVSDLAAVFAGVDDKRIKNPQVIKSDKILMIKGVSIFAGIEIRSY
ncbi:LiaF transmembrane domain-containing protein [Mucilaginibacter segetis]|uniref:Cell wall-active antibiotic response 4TMS protein YvqF n=1 Tax=Mucilaginibacter segetis TaxID=2793071 RepID=A0A934ULI1_9SPHI|nr:DUF5668 domain-containing protein [Mucilaginibacter segetis]MBK0378369.1 hypothetical protein [Mucilaginibacter segetis]